MTSSFVNVGTQNRILQEFSEFIWSSKNIYFGKKFLGMQNFHVYF